MVKNRWVKLLGSINFAILLMGLMACSVIAGTIIESKTGSHKVASHYIYSNPLFVILLIGFFINILFSTFTRYPFKKHHIPFLITHLGLLMLISGALFKITLGQQGVLVLKEGITKDHMMLDDTWALSIRKKGSDEWHQVELKKDWRGHLTTHYSLDDLQIEVMGFAPHGEETLNTWIKGDYLITLGNPPLPLNVLGKVDGRHVIATRDPDVIKNELQELPAIIFLEDPTGVITTLEINEKGDIHHEEYDPKKLGALYAYDDGFQGYSVPFFFEGGELETPLSRKYKPATPPVKAEEERPLVSLRLKKGNKEDQHALLFASSLATGVLQGEYLIKFEALKTKLPTPIRLREATATLYPNSTQPQSYSAEIYANGKKEQLSMNKVWESDNGTRFYLANITPLDESSVKEVRFVVNHDPYKRWLTYPGGMIVGLGIVLLFTRRRKE